MTFDAWAGGISSINHSQKNIYKMKIIECTSN